MKQKKRGLDWFAVIVGAGFLSIGIGVFVANLDFIRFAVQTEGIIVDAVQKQPKRLRHRTKFAPTYASVFAFSTPDGTEYRAQSTFFSGFSPSIGKQVTILYLPNNPMDVMENNWFYLYGFPGIFVVLGALLIGIPAYRSIPKRT